MALAKLRESLHVSASQVKAFLICPRQYELKYVRGTEPAFVPFNLAFGSAFHAALAAFYGLVKETGASPSLDEITSVFRDAWENASDGSVPLEADEDESFDPIDKGVAMLSVFYKHATSKPLPEVVAVERGWAVTIHDPATGERLEEKLVGAFDLVTREDEGYVITEHKTAARKWSADQLAYDHQPTAYSLAATQLGLTPVSTRMQVVTKTKTPQVQVEDVPRGQHDLDDFLRTTVGVLRAIDAGAFWPNRGWPCRSCPYAHACATQERRQ